MAFLEEAVADIAAPATEPYNCSCSVDPEREDGKFISTEGVHDWQALDQNQPRGI